MIIVYPMLTSPSVSVNLLPGIIKAIEKYIIVYHTDEVLRYGSRTSAGRIIATGAKIALGAAVAGAATAAAGAAADKAADWIVSSKDNTQEPGSRIVEFIPPGPSTKSTGKEKEKMPIPTRTDVGPPKSSLDLPRTDAVSLEPTWITITTEKKGTQLLGVKVVPFTLKSTHNITDLMLQDTELKKLDLLQAKYGRGIMRVLYRLLKTVGISKGGVTEDPKKDIIYGATAYKKNMFLCLSQLDIESNDFLTQPTSIRKLQQLGWASFVITDDVNKRATFCMKEFGGICSVVPYNFMFASLGREINKAYEDLDDLKKSSGPFFNMRTNRKRVFTEYNMTNVDKYLQLLNKGR